MKKITSLPLLLLLLSACGTATNEPVASSAATNLNTANNFIRAALDGKFMDARSFMLQDSVNNNYMDIAERSYNNTDQTVKDGYKASSIRIHNVNEINDSLTIIIYSNSFKNDHDTLKVLKTNNQWLVDLKYLYEHDAANTDNPTVPKDTLQ